MELANLRNIHKYAIWYSFPFLVYLLVLDECVWQKQETHCRSTVAIHQLWTPCFRIVIQVSRLGFEEYFPKRKLLQEVNIISMNRVFFCTEILRKSPLLVQGFRSPYDESLSSTVEQDLLSYSTHTYTLIWSSDWNTVVKGIVTPTFLGSALIEVSIVAFEIATCGNFGLAPNIFHLHPSIEYMNRKPPVPLLSEPKIWDILSPLIRVNFTKFSSKYGLGCWRDIQYAAESKLRKQINLIVKGQLIYMLWGAF